MPNSTLIDPFGRTEGERHALAERNNQINEYARANWHDPQFHREFAADLTETIYRGFTHENLLSLMTTVQNLGFDDRAFVKEVRGLRSHWIARGGYIEASTTNAKVIEIPRNTVGFHVYELEDKIMVNFAETQANLIQLGLERLDAEVNAMFLKTLQAAIPNAGSSSYFAVNGLTLPTLNRAMLQVRDASRSQQLAIVGRAPMTLQILDQLLGATNVNGSGFLPETNEQLMKMGVIGNYRGASIISLVNWLDDTDTPYFPANELFVIGIDASRFAFFGGLMGKEWIEDEADYWHYRTRRDCGVVVHRPQRVARIVDGNITAFTVGA